MRSPYVGLWLLLALSITIIAIVSFVDADISIGSYTLKKSAIADVLNGNRENIDTIGEREGLSDLKVQEIVVDSAPQSLFIFGDSMTLNLALRLAQYAKQNGHTINSVNWDSSNTKIWAESDTLNYFIKKFKPTFIFISLGSNELYFKNPDARRPYVEKILEKIGDIPHVWIGPPNWEKDSGINDMLQKVVGKKSFFRTDGMQLARKKDKIHPTREASALWIDSVMRWLPSSAHPFVAEMPSDSIGKSNPGIVFLKAHSK